MVVVAVVVAVVAVVVVVVGIRIVLVRVNALVRFPHRRDRRRGPRRHRRASPSAPANRSSRPRTAREPWARQQGQTIAPLHHPLSRLSEADVILRHVVCAAPDVKLLGLVANRALEVLAAKRGEGGRHCRNLRAICKDDVGSRLRLQAINERTRRPLGDVPYYRVRFVHTDALPRQLVIDPTSLAYEPLDELPRHAHRAVRLHACGANHDEQHEPMLVRACRADHGPA